LKGEDAHGDHGLGSWYKLGLRPPPPWHLRFTSHLTIILIGTT